MTTMHDDEPDSAPPPQSDADRVGMRFRESPEYQALRAVTAAVHPSAPHVAFTLKVDPAFFPLIERLAAVDAERRGTTPDSIADEMERILNIGLHDILHRAIVSPTTFATYREIWDSICDEMKLPMEKSDAPESESEDYANIPF